MMLALGIWPLHRTICTELWNALVILILLTGTIVQVFHLIVTILLIFCPQPIQYTIHCFFVLNDM